MLPVAHAVRDLYLHPDVTDDHDLAPGGPDRDGIVRFLCDEHAFGRERVEAAIERTWR